jgi:hypothetical protein
MAHADSLHCLCQQNRFPDNLLSLKPSQRNEDTPTYFGGIQVTSFNHGADSLRTDAKEFCYLRDGVDCFGFDGHRGSAFQFVDDIPDFAPSAVRITTISFAMSCVSYLRAKHGSYPASHSAGALPMGA